jgi:small GTP-binding protein
VASAWIAIETKNSEVEGSHEKKITIFRHTRRSTRPNNTVSFYNSQLAVYTIFELKKRMIIPPKRSNETLFEIKIALLGYVSVGKTTVLNALLKDKYSEVSMRRTTACVNYFRIHTATAKSEGDMQPKCDSIDKLLFTSTETLGVITNENAKLRDSGTFLLDGKVHEETFDIEIDEPIISEMRADTQLVLVDIPGLNEADTKDMYRDYVTNKLWSTLDCVIVVMDVSQGVNTEEQVQLLEMVKQNCKEKKNVPILVVCNKVDDPDNAEIMELVNEVRAKVELIFSNKQLPFDASTNETTDKKKDAPTNKGFEFGTATSTIPSPSAVGTASTIPTFGFGTTTSTILSPSVVGTASTIPSPLFGFGTTTSTVPSPSVVGSASTIPSPPFGSYSYTFGTTPPTVETRNGCNVGESSFCEIVASFHLY